MLKKENKLILFVVFWYGIKTSIDMLTTVLSNLGDS